MGPQDNGHDSADGSTALRPSIKLESGALLKPSGCAEEPRVQHAVARVGTSSLTDMQRPPGEPAVRLLLYQSPIHTTVVTVRTGVYDRLTAMAPSVSQTLRSVTPLELNMLYRTYVESGELDARIDRAMKRYVVMK